eukprot:gnl/TRDRNA2_/TRDRNA2_191346_c0_seq1.p1 gnl/TRDRNA2_/TRDRNA2_191346_c0~~gnl/TRDRNA2_/TRDRNA2_191346_c0_seq1.p1  ORF type:complete len:224 (-),score=40.48 gnl/TRDRNA2_/TRDRNA2_191346_c0_seq1:73-705(-)
MVRSVLLLLLVSAVAAVEPSVLRKQPGAVSSIVAARKTEGIVVRSNYDPGANYDSNGAGNTEKTKEVACGECSNYEKLLDSGHHRCICHVIKVTNSEERDKTDLSDRDLSLAHAMVADAEKRKADAAAALAKAQAEFDAAQQALADAKAMLADAQANNNAAHGETKMSGGWLWHCKSVAEENYGYKDPYEQCAPMGWSHENGKTVEGTGR